MWGAVGRVLVVVGAAEVLDGGRGWLIAFALDAKMALGNSLEGRHYYSRRCAI